MRLSNEQNRNRRVQRPYDVAVIGSGPSGAIAARELARAGRSVILIDRLAPMGRKIGESLPAAARPLLRHLGLIELLDQGPHLAATGNHSAWGSAKLQAVDFIRDPHGLGWHLDRLRFDEDLRASARSSGADWLEGRVRRVSRCEHEWLIQTDEVQVRANWVVDSTGRSASIARLLGARRFRDDGLTAVCGWLRARRGERDARTWIEASPSGWWYSACLPDRSRVVVYHTSADEARALLRAPELWRERLSETDHLRALAGKKRLLGPLLGAEACGARLDRFSGERWVAVGDAALSFDPLSSQGIFNSLYTGMKGARAIDAVLGGHAGELGGYSARLEEIRAAYLLKRNHFYSVERRWSDRDFWNLRLA